MQGGEYAGKGHNQNEYEGVEEAEVGAGGDGEAGNTEGAAELMGVSGRQVRLLVKAARKEGERGLVHRSTARALNITGSNPLQGPRESRRN